VIELGSNDGYLLKEFVAAGIPVLGIDPSDTVAAAAERIGVHNARRVLRCAAGCAPGGGGAQGGFDCRQ
jgi:hypothetical protein